MTKGRGMLNGMHAIRLNVEIEGIREAIVSRIALREEDLSERLEEGLTRAITEVDVAAIAERHARSMIERAVETTVSGVVSSLAYDGKVQEAIKRRLAEALLEGLDA